MKKTRRTSAGKTGSARRKAPASKARKPVRRPARKKTVATPAAQADVQPVPATAEPPSGVRISVDGLVVEATEPEVEGYQLRAQLSVRQGDQIIHAERVNLDWPGGWDKFLRNAGRALEAAGVTTRITDAVLSELHGQLRARAGTQAPTPRPAPLDPLG